MTEQMMIDLMLANQAEIYDKKLAQKQSEVDSMCFYAERLEKQVTQLRAELNDYKDCRHDLLDKVDVLTASLSAAQKRVEEAMYYTNHKPLCCTNFGGNDKPCDCGYSAWMEKEK